MLRVADDVDGLCALVGRLSPAPLSAQDRRSIDREFGVDAVRAALRNVVTASEPVATRQDQ